MTGQSGGVLELLAGDSSDTESEARGRGLYPKVGYCYWPLQSQRREMSELTGWTEKVDDFSVNKILTHYLFKTQNRNLNLFLHSNGVYSKTKFSNLTRVPVSLFTF